MAIVMAGPLVLSEWLCTVQAKHMGHKKGQPRVMYSMAICTENNHHSKSHDWCALASDFSHAFKKDFF